MSMVACKKAKIVPRRNESNRGGYMSMVARKKAKIVAR